MEYLLWSGHSVEACMSWHMCSRDFAASMQGVYGCNHYMCWTLLQSTCISTISNLMVLQDISVSFSKIRNYSLYDAPQKFTPDAKSVCYVPCINQALWNLTAATMRTRTDLQLLIAFRCAGGLQKVGIWCFVINFQLLSFLLTLCSLKQESMTGIWFVLWACIALETLAELLSWLWALWPVTCCH